MKCRNHVVAVSLVACVWAVVTAAAQVPRQGAQNPKPPASGPTLATVGGLRVEGPELESAVQEAIQAYTARTHLEMDPQLEPLVRRQILENLIRQRLLSLEAARRGMTVTQAEADAELRKDPVFQSGGVFNEARYLSIKATNPVAYERSIAAIKQNLAAGRARQQMERDVRPDDVALRAQLERELTRATIEYLALRSAEIDGSYPEPREADVLAYYRSHAVDFRRPEQATVSIIPINRPAIPDSAGASDTGFRVWEQFMRARADSARAAIRAGSSFETIAGLYGGARRNVVVRRAKLPDFWRGDAKDVDAVFAAAPGAVLEPVRAASGWILVRVDAVLPPHAAPLREVTREIRSTLRTAAKTRDEDRDLREIYAAYSENLKGEAYRVRYAIADTGSFSPGEPTAQDLDRFYRSHMADYSSYDRASGQIVETPLARVREEIRGRWIHDRRLELARAAAERLRDAWSRGHRDPVLEKSMTAVREPGMVLAGSSVGEGPTAEALNEALTGRNGQAGAWVVPAPGGFLVCHIGETVASYVPTFEQARSLLIPRREQHVRPEVEAAARQLYLGDSSSFRAPRNILFSRMVVPPPNLFAVPLSRAEVERYFRGHINDYTVQELVRVRHILISPTGPGPQADAAARTRAEEITRRVKAGEDFVKLAAQYSDDPATKNDGGDVGVFRHGQMREAFERAAFAMRPGDITGPVKSEVGYHVLECLEYAPPVIHPIGQVYANVAHDCAIDKATRMATDRADSLYRTLKSVAQAREMAKRLGLDVIPNNHEVGTVGRYPAELRAYAQKLETLGPGQIYPGIQVYQGLGPVITWVDAVDPPRSLPWQEARALAIQRYEEQRKRSALIAKRAELDSMAAAGWSFDSLATLWGGFERLVDAAPGVVLTGLGGRVLLDSLVFGRSRPAVLTEGQWSSWVDFPGGLVKLRIASRVSADPDELQRRLEARRQVMVWHRLNDYFDKLKARYPVQILDSELRATKLPEPTEES